MGLKLKADPTFRVPVKIPVPGGPSEAVAFIFKHRTRSELIDFQKWVEDKTNFEVVDACVVGWDLTDEFTRQNIEQLLDSYIGATKAILRTYMDELTGARLGN